MSNNHTSTDNPKEKVTYDIPNNKFVEWVVKHRFIAVGLFFGIWMAFFDGNNVIFQQKLRNQINDVQNASMELKKDIDDITIKLEQINNDPEEQEMLFREYRLTKKNEDVIIIQ